MFSINEGFLNTEISNSKEELPISPRDHQKEAIVAAKSYYQNNNRGKLVLPCGTGKTLTALWIKEALEAKNVLILLPSLLLVKQFKEVWVNELKKISQAKSRDNNTLDIDNGTFEYLCVCSDERVDENTKDNQAKIPKKGEDVKKDEEIEIDEDENELSLEEIENDVSRVTTKPFEIAQFLQATHSSKIIFSTYHSLHRIERAIADYYINFSFDLLICDEAHRTASWSSKDNGNGKVIKKSKFSICHEDEHIPSKKRLYMTATPKVSKFYEDIDKEEDYIYCMNDAEFYGTTIYEMSFKDAIDQNLLVDYHIVVVGLEKDQNIDEILTQHKYLLEKNETAEDIINNIILDNCFKKYNLEKVITFHNKIIEAQKFKNRHEQLYSTTKSYHINGKTKAEEREGIFDNFKNISPSIITNAKCLSEGIDIPSISAVYFCNKKTSTIDIVQAAGRALRKAEKKEKGYIVIPLKHSKKENTLNALKNSAEFKKVTEILLALKDQDKRLEAYINKQALAQEPGKQEEEEEEFKDTKLIIVDGFEETIREGLFYEIITKIRSPWDKRYEEFKNFINKNKYLPRTSTHTKDKEELRLYTWLTQQEKSFYENTLDKEQIERLQEIEQQLWDIDFEQFKKCIIDDGYFNSQTSLNTIVFNDYIKFYPNMLKWLTIQARDLYYNTLSIDKYEKLDFFRVIKEIDQIFSHGYNHSTYKYCTYNRNKRDKDYLIKRGKITKNDLIILKNNFLRIVNFKQVLHNIGKIPLLQNEQIKNANINFIEQYRYFLVDKISNNEDKSSFILEIYQNSQNHLILIEYIKKNYRLKYTTQGAILKENIYNEKEENIGWIEYWYNNLEQLVMKHKFDAIKRPVDTMIYRYNLKGQIKVELKYNVKRNLIRALGYDYNSKGYVKSVIKYFDPQILIDKELDSQGFMRHYFTYNGANARMCSSIYYKYDTNGNKIFSKKDMYNGSPVSKEYIYDRNLSEIKKYNDKNEIIWIMKMRYDSNNQKIGSKKYIYSTGRIIEEKIYDRSEQLIYSTKFIYHAGEGEKVGSIQYKYNNTGDVVEEQYFNANGQKIHSKPIE